MQFVRFMESGVGRLARVAAGLVLVGLGAWLGTSQTAGWWGLAAVGLVPLGAGAFDVCLAAPLFGAPLRHVRPGA